MRVVILKNYGDAEVLQLEKREKPQPKENEVLIKVAASGLNRADISQRKGHYPAPKGTPQNILGLEVSGTVEAKGDQVNQWEVGQQVCALLPGGGYAEYVTIDAGSCLPIPKNYDLIDAASLPEVLFTVWHNVFQRGRLQKGEEVFVYGGSGGIGSMAIQLINLFGASVNTLASTEQKIAYCRALGAKKVLNYTSENILEQLGRDSMDLIFDSFGGDYLSTNLEMLKIEGRLVYINAMLGGFPKIELFKMMQKRLWITGSTLRSRAYSFKAQLADEIKVKAYPLLEDKRFTNMVTRRFPVEKVVEAHQLMGSRDFLGKIILTF